MKRVLRQCWWRRLASSHLLPALPAGALGMAAGLRTVAASCAILPLSWDHRRRGCPPSKTGFRPRSRHLRSRPSSTGPRRAAHTGGLCRRSAAYPLSIAYSRAAWAATLASPGLLPILLLVGSNLFITLAWYGHLRFKEVAARRGHRRELVDRLPGILPGGAGEALGSAVYTAAQLKTIQEVITLVVFAGFSVFCLK